MTSVRSAAPRFFVALPLAHGARVELPRDVAHHAFRVLRLAEGAEVTLFNGEGGEYRALLDSAQRGTARVSEHLDVEREAPLDLTLVQSLVATEKLDWIVEKATELGAARVLLLPAERSVVRLQGERLARRLQHLRSVAQAACEQCGRNRVPMVEWVGSLTEVRTQLPQEAVLLLLAPGVPSQSSAALATRSFAIAVGPEGGFTEAELRQAQSAGFVARPLGPRVLRTETAGLAALAALLARHGDLGLG